MDTSRKIAIVVGILYIIGTIAGVLSVLVTQPVFGGSDFLTKISEHESYLMTGALLVLTMGLALALVPVLLYPVLRKYNEILALGYVVFRGALETITDVVLAICWLFLIAISREFVATGAASGSILQSLGTVFMKGSDSISNVMAIVFSLDAMMLYTILYRNNLVPRWISIWGFIAIVLHFSTAFLRMYHLLNPGLSQYIDILNIPIFFQEMVMAVWLIVKGFDFTANESRIAKVDVNYAQEAA